VKNKTVSRLALSIGALSIVAYACGGGDTGEIAELTGGAVGTGATGGTIPQAATGGTAAGAGGATAGGATGGTGIIGTGGLIQTTGGSGGMAPIEEDAACGTGMASASLKPVNMFVVFDRSSSMLECGSGDAGGMMGGGMGCETGPTRWAMTSMALTQFFQDPGAADLGVALRFYPHDQPVPGCTGDMAMNPALADGGMGCDINACATPMVDMGVLTAEAAPTDAHEAALVNAVMLSAPLVAGEGTPTYVALAGAAQWAVAYQQAHAEQRTVIVLVTDGEPNGCNTETDAIAGLAADAFTTAEVRTYAIGLAIGGGSQAFMNEIALAGGTEQAFFVSDGATATADLLAALNAIRGMALACDFPVPSATSSGMAIDPGLINVNFTSTAGGEIELGLVASAAECADQLAWYYDDPMMPTRIMLCPSACTSVTADANASIAILAGCKPRIPVTK
jgi:hypothetical protein